jgi:hypothetical protein
MYFLALPVLLIVLFVLMKMPAKGGPSIPSFMAQTVSPFQQNLDEELGFLSEAYRENAKAEKRAEVAAKASKYFVKSE